MKRAFILSREPGHDPMTPAAMLDELARYFPDHVALQEAISAAVVRLGPGRRMAAVLALLIEMRTRG